MHPNAPITLAEVAEILDQGGYVYTPNGADDELRSQCPSHDGAKPNAWWRERVGTTGETYVNVLCFSGGKKCTDVAIYAALGLVAEGLRESTKEFVMPVKKGGRSRGSGKGGKFTRAEWLAMQFSGFNLDTMEVKDAAAYTFVQYNGQPFATKRRLQAYNQKTGERVLTDQKSFQWTPKRKNWPAPHPPLFHGRALVELLKDRQDGRRVRACYDDVYACEGEKAVNTAGGADVLAVCGHTGCNTKLQPADLGLLKTYTETTGGSVVVVRDLDEAGHKFARGLSAQLAAAGIRFRVVESATGEATHDLHDHLEAGHGPEELVDVTDEYSSTSVSAQ